MNRLSGWIGRHRRLTAGLVMCVIFAVGAFSNVYPMVMTPLVTLGALACAMLIDWQNNDLHVLRRGKGGVRSHAADVVAAADVIWKTIRASEAERRLPVVLLVGREGVGKSAIVQEIAGERSAKMLQVHDEYALWHIPALSWILEIRGAVGSGFGAQLFDELVRGSPSVEVPGVVAGVILAEDVAAVTNSEGRITADLRKRVLALKQERVDFDNISFLVLVTQCDRLFGFDEVFESLARRSDQLPGQLGAWRKPTESINDTLDRFRELVVRIVLDRLDQTSPAAKDIYDVLEFANQAYTLAQHTPGWLNSLMAGRYATDERIEVEGLFFGHGPWDGSGGSNASGHRDEFPGPVSNSPTFQRLDLAAPITPKGEAHGKWTPRRSGFGFGGPFREFLQRISHRRGPARFQEFLVRFGWIPVASFLLGAFLTMASFLGEVALLKDLAGANQETAREIARERAIQNTTSPPEVKNALRLQSRVRQVGVQREVVEQVMSHHGGVRTGLRRVYYNLPALMSTAHRMYVLNFRRTFGDALLRLAEGRDAFCRAGDGRVTPQQCMMDHQLIELLAVSPTNSAESRRSANHAQSVLVLMTAWSALLSAHGVHPRESMTETIRLNSELLVSLLEYSTQNLRQTDVALESSPIDRRLTPQEAALETALSSPDVRSAVRECGAPLPLPDVLRASSLPPVEFSTCVWSRALRARLITESSVVMDELVRRHAARLSNDENCRLIGLAYARRHLSAWNLFLSGVEVRHVANEDGARRLLEEMYPDSDVAPAPLRHLFRYVKAQALHGPPSPRPGAPNLLDRFRRSRHPSIDHAACLDGASTEVRTGLTPLLSLFQTEPGTREPLADYHDHLRRILNAMNAHAAAAGQPDSTDGELATTVTLIPGYVGASNSALRQTISRLLRSPLELVSQQVARSRVAELEREWCEGVVRPYDRTLAGRSTLGNTPPDLAVFAQFYGDSGTLWRFVDTRLTSDLRLSPNGRDYQPVSVFARANISPQFIRYLGTMQPLRTFSRASGAMWRMDTRARLVGGDADAAARVLHVEVDEARIDSDHETLVSWPASSLVQDRGARLCFTEGDVSVCPDREEGPWGWLRLLRRARISHRRGEPAFSAAWPARDNWPAVIINAQVIQGADVLFGAGYESDFPGLWRPPALPRSLCRGSVACARGAVM